MIVVSDEAKARKRLQQQVRNKEHPEYIKSWRKENIIKCMLQVVRARARQKNYEYSLLEDDLILPKTCPVFGFPLESHISKESRGPKDNSYSIDRIDNSKGYTKDNIQIISNKANAMKHNATKEELIQFAEWILKEYKY